MRKTLPAELTSYDFLKSFVLVLMMIDHVGAFFFPEQEMLRWLGRLCVPVWFFLIGFARSRDIDAPLILGGLLLVAGSMMIGSFVFPLNILFTIMAIRLVIDPLMRLTLWNPVVFWLVPLGLLVLAYPSYALLDYGTLGLLFAMYGYMARRGGMALLPFMLVAVLAYSAAQVMIFPFGTAHGIALMAVLALMLWQLRRFRLVLYPHLTQRLPVALTGLIKLTGRRTLLIYVGHLLLLQFLAYLIYPERYIFLDWKWLYFSL